MAEDFLGKRINIGDRVVFMQRAYRNLLVGTIEKITDKTVIIKHAKTNIGDTQTKQFHNQVVVV